MRFGNNGTTPSDSDADRLNATWNQIVSGHQASGADDLTEIVQRLHATASTVHPRPTFKRQLKETLLETALTAPVGMRGSPRISSSVQTRPITMKPSHLEVDRRGRASVGWTKWTALAAAALIAITTAGGAYLGGLYGNDNSGLGTFVAAPVDPNGTPEPTQDDLSTYPDTCLSPNGNCRNEILVSTAIINDGFEASYVQLELWELAGGETATFISPEIPLIGSTTDFVIEGSYIGTFSQPVSITRNSKISVLAGVEFFDAGDEVEIGQGDSVTYQPGTQIQVKNPFSGLDLVVRTVGFYDDLSSLQLLGASDNVNYRVATDSAHELSQESQLMIKGGEFALLLTYMFIGDDYEFPPSDTTTIYLFGPSSGFEDEHPGARIGFVVWLVKGLG